MSKRKGTASRDRSTKLSVPIRPGTEVVVRVDGGEIEGTVLRAEILGVRVRTYTGQVVYVEWETLLIKATELNVEWLEGMEDTDQIELTDEAFEILDSLDARRAVLAC